MADVLVLGVGPGIGAAVARRLARDGGRVGHVARSRENLDTWAVNVVGAITAAAVVLPLMARRGSGTMLVTSGMPVPDPALTSLSLGKAGVRALVQLLDSRHGPDGVHVASVTVTGPVEPGSAWDPDEIAERYAELHAQSREDWQHEVVHGPVS